MSTRERESARDPMRLEAQARRSVRKAADDLEGIADALRNCLAQSAESRNTVDFLDRVVAQMRTTAGQWKGGAF